MKKYDNFCSALSNMKQIYKYTEPYDDTVILTGLVGLYEICFEQSWKMMKEVLSMHGYEDIALEIVSQAKESFYTMFCDLKNEIDANWL